MKHVSFIILNYYASELTIGCIESILKNIKYNNISIVVVDNGSPNESGEYLQKLYRNEKAVTVLLSDKNLGFANGNNLGYKYAKEKLNADYMVITNSDTIFEQSNFVELLIEFHEKEKYYIAGPDLYTPGGMHQNPRRMKMLSKNEVKKVLLIKQIFLWYFKLKQSLHIGDKIHILEDWYAHKDKNNQKNRCYDIRYQDVVLVGACIIYSPEYIANEKYGFCPDTFMYGEEDLLTYMCMKKNYKIMYFPELSVYHLNGETTKKKYENVLEKNIFTYKYIIEGCKILLKHMKEK